MQLFRPRFCARGLKPQHSTAKSDDVLLFRTAAFPLVDNAGRQRRITARSQKMRNNFHSPRENETVWAFLSHTLGSELTSCQRRPFPFSQHEAPHQSTSTLERSGDHIRPMYCASYAPRAIDWQARLPSFLSTNRPARSLRRRRYCLVTSLGEHDRPLATMLRFPTFHSPPSLLAPSPCYCHPLLSDVPLRSGPCTSNISTCFFAPRNRLPVGRMYRYAVAVRSVEQRRCIRPRALICSFGHELELRDTLRTHRR